MPWIDDLLLDYAFPSLWPSLYRLRVARGTVGVLAQQIAAVIERARAIKKEYEVISPYLFPTQKGEAYSKSELSSMWRRAKDRAGIKDDVTFKDIRALGATDAAKSGQDRKDIQTRLAHTSGKTTEIYIKEAIADVSDIATTLPW